MPEGLSLLTAAVIGYLFGSIPFGLLLTRLAGHGDIRSIGSGNIGATNVLRTGSRGLAAATLAGDAAKGWLAVIVGGLLGPMPALVAGVASLAGHVFPVWLRFRGGKGIATFLGVMLGLNIWLALTFAVAWLAVAAAIRISSAAALAATAAVVIVGFVVEPPLVAAVIALMVALLWWRHADNIRRLLAGTESRIGDKT